MANLGLSQKCNQNHCQELFIEVDKVILCQNGKAKAKNGQGSPLKDVEEKPSYQIYN